jgi:hypothetical protein
MSEVSIPARPRTLRRWLQSTSNRTFAVYPAVVIAVELLLNRGDLEIVPWAAPLLLWGYLQYRLCGNYRTRLGGGGPGLDVPPQRIVDSGIYRFIRNPMYLGHLIFMLGLALTFRSWLAVALLAWIILVGGVAGRQDRHTRELAERLAAGDDEPSEDLTARLRDPLNLALNASLLVATVAVVALMVWKP